LLQLRRMPGACSTSTCGKSFSRVEIIEQSLRLANVLKLNDSELPVARGFIRSGKIAASPNRNSLPKDSTSARGFDARAGRAASLFREGSWSEQAPHSGGKSWTLYGAGDAFTAALVMGLLLEMRLDEKHAWAARNCAPCVFTRGCDTANSPCRIATMLAIGPCPPTFTSPTSQLRLVPMNSPVTMQSQFV
jgi:sugar/nucleoside kinase (ribokinase family)